jgi:universal stress protein A
MTQDMLCNSVSGPVTIAEKGVQVALEGGDLFYKKILVPIDFSEHSKKTVSYATAFASRYNATVQLLHVFEIPDDAATLYGGRSQTCNQMKSQVDAAEEEARENLTVFENQLLNAGVKVEAYVRVGFPFDEIVQMASYFDVDLIIVGSHGYTGMTRLLLGSTAERVVERAPCPVLVVKERRRQREEKRIGTEGNDLPTITGLF